MRIRTFEAPTIDKAMQMVREAIGDEAIILSTTRIPSGRGVRVTAAIEPEEEVAFEDVLANDREAADSIFPAEPSISEPSPAVPRPRPIPEGSALGRFIRILGYHRSPDYLTEQLHQVAQEKEDTFGHDLSVLVREVLDSCFSFSPISLTPNHPPVMMIGPPGVGKTVTCAKLAAEAVLNKQPVTVITTDTKRAGAIEQLQAFTDILGLDLHTTDDPAELAAMLDASHHTVTIIDSAGANPYDANELRSLGNLINADPDIEPILVCNAGMDTSEAADLANSFSYLGAGRMVLTKTDATRRYGGLLSAASSAGIILSNISRNASVAEGLEVLDAATLTELLLAHGEEI